MAYSRHDYFTLQLPGSLSQKTCTYWRFRTCWRNFCLVGGWFHQEQDKETRHFLFVVYVNVSYFGSRSSEVRVYLKHFICICEVDFAFLRQIDNSSQYSYWGAVKWQTCHMLYQILYLLPYIIIRFLCSIRFCSIFIIFTISVIIIINKSVNSAIRIVTMLNV